MAESLTREGPIDVLESAVGVLRQAGLSTLVLHWAGSVPFALALLVFWMIRIRFTGAYKKISMPYKSQTELSHQAPV